MRDNSELMVITKSKEIISYIFSIMENSPKKFRFTLFAKLENVSLEVLESLILANETRLGICEADNMKRKQLQRTAIAKLKILDAFSMIAREQKCILPKQYEVMTRLIRDCLNLTGAWIKSDQQRLR